LFASLEPEIAFNRRRKPNQECRHPVESDWAAESRPRIVVFAAIVDRRQAKPENPRRLPWGRRQSAREPLGAPTSSSAEAPESTRRLTFPKVRTA